MQSLQHSERAVVYSTLGTFLQSYLEGDTLVSKFVCVHSCESGTHLDSLFSISVLQEMGSDFVLGYIQAMDGERDPRNLLSIFSTLPTLIDHLPFGR